MSFCRVMKALISSVHCYYWALGRIIPARPCRSLLPMLVATQSERPSMLRSIEQQQQHRQRAFFSTKTTQTSSQNNTTTKNKHKHENSPLLPRTVPDPDTYEYRPFRWPRTYQQWKIVLTTTWRNYRSTWEGFPYGTTTTTTTTSNETTTDVTKDNDDMLSNIHIPKQEEVVDNVKQNISFLQDHGTDLVNKAQDETGIRTKEDLKKWAGEQLKLATECLSEFMNGYRKGRDVEVDKMLHEYFQDLEGNDETEESKEPKRRRRRKPKRRIRKF